MSARLVNRDDRGPVAVLTLDRPLQRNALSRALLEQLRDALDKVSGDERIRAIVLTGAGVAFCTGMDLKEAAAMDAAADAAMHACLVRPCTLISLMNAAAATPARKKAVTARKRSKDAARRTSPGAATIVRRRAKARRFFFRCYKLSCVTEQTDSVRAADSHELPHALDLGDHDRGVGRLVLQLGGPPAHSAGFLVERMENVGIGDVGAKRICRNSTRKAGPLADLSRPEQSTRFGVERMEHRVVRLGKQQVARQADLDQPFGFDQGNNSKPMALETNPLE